MIQLHTSAGTLVATVEDFNALFKLNPIALEQIKSVMLERALREANEKLAQANGRAEDLEPERAGREEKDTQYE